MNWPLATRDYPIPTGDDPGAFGVQRKGYVHPGVDLYCEPDTEVYAIEDGVVVSVEDFTGPKVDAPWWNDTEAVLVEGKTGVICYGEVEALVKEGYKVDKGQLLGKVKTVMKKYKGNPMTMLHFELYSHGTKEAVDWFEMDKRPKNLQDPTDLLIRINDICPRSSVEERKSSKLLVGSSNLSEGAKEMTNGNTRKNN